MRKAARTRLAGSGLSENKYFVLASLPLSNLLWSLCNDQNLLEAREPRSPVDMVSRGHLLEQKPVEKSEVDLEWKIDDSRDRKT